MAFFNLVNIYINIVDKVIVGKGYKYSIIVENNDRFVYKKEKENFKTVVVIITDIQHFQIQQVYYQG